MIFERQDYQQECIGNIISVLEDFDFDTHNAENLKNCLNKFYTTHTMPLKNLSNKLNLDILMETGTGKTFTYLNLIFELHRNFKQNKFIIFVPRKAILESAKQNIKLTKDYFYTQYNKHLKAYVYSDTKSQSAIINHYVKNTDELSVLILTNSAIDKKDNILDRSSEALFNVESIFTNIANLKPISIIDEPHLLKGEAFNKYFSQINSLYFRFGATFPKEKEYELSNIVYCLDSMSAFNNYLVKQIHTHTIIQDNDNPYLIRANSKERYAMFSCFVNGVEKQKRINLNQDLGDLDSNDFCKNEPKGENPTISDITIERVKRAGAKIAKEHRHFQGDLGFSVYSLCEKPNLVCDKEGHLELLTGRKGITPSNITKNLSLQCGKRLDKGLECIIESKLYKYDDVYCVVECDKEVLEILWETKNEYIFIDGYTNMDLEEFLNLKNSANIDK